MLNMVMILVIDDVNTALNIDIKMPIAVKTRTYQIKFENLTYNIAW